MVQLCGWYTWKPTSKAKLQEAEENMLEGGRQVALHVYLQKGFFTKRLFQGYRYISGNNGERRIF